MAMLGTSFNLAPTGIQSMSFRRMLLFFLLFTVLVLATLFFFPRTGLWVMGHLNPRVTFYVETQEKVVGLSIDDGPTSAITPGILRLLKENDAHATFFLLGERIVGHEDLLERMLSEGDELGNHLWKDEASIGLKRAVFSSQLARVDSLLSRHSDPKLFRPGSGWFHKAILDELTEQGYRCVLASNYPLDTKTHRVGLIEKYLLRSVFPGAILVLHDGPGREHTLAVLARLLPALKERGYQVLTVSELLARADKAQRHRRES